MSSPIRTSARVAAALILLLVPADARSQETSSRKTVRIAANPKYKASGLRRILLGFAPQSVRFGDDLFAFFLRALLQLLEAALRTGLFQ